MRPAVVVVSLLALGCEAPPPRAAPPAPPAPAPSAAPTRTPDLRLTPLEVFDPGIGTRAFTMLIPTGWQHEGGVLWQHQYANLATAQLVVRDPKSAAALELFPVIPGCWDASGMLPPGQNYMGSYVAQPPADAAAYVTQYFIPGHRANKGARVVKSTPLPDVARAVAQSTQEPGVRKQVTAARVRIEYPDGGQTIAEDVFITLSVSRADILPNMIIWSLEHQHSFRAERERIDALEPLFEAMASSVRLDLPWYAGYMQVVQLWRDGQMQSIKSAGELSRRISRNNDAILEDMRASWSERQASQDRVYRQFSDSIRGVETVQHPFESRPVEVPAGYDDVWVNARGEVLLSNHAGVDPNVGDTNEWRRAQR